jgi:Domain of unknown function (DUF1772)
MNEWLAIAMLISGGLFAGGVVPIAWERGPAWRVASPKAFRADFAHTLTRVDRVQPALLVVTLLSAIAFALNATGTARTLSAFSAFGLAVILFGSGAVLVRIQQRLVSPRSELAASDVERLREQWLRGHLLRTILAVACFALLVAAVAM